VVTIVVRGGGRGIAYVDFHLAVQAIAKDEMVCKLHPMRFHGVARSIVEMTHITYHHSSTVKIIGHDDASNHPNKAH